MAAPGPAYVVQQPVVVVEDHHHHGKKGKKHGHPPGRANGWHKHDKH